MELDDAVLPAAVFVVFPLELDAFAEELVSVTTSTGGGGGMLDCESSDEDPPAVVELVAVVVVVVLVVVAVDVAVVATVVEVGVVAVAVAVVAVIVAVVVGLLVSIGDALLLELLARVTEFVFPGLKGSYKFGFDSSFATGCCDDWLLDPPSFPELDGIGSFPLDALAAD